MHIEDLPLVLLAHICLLAYDGTGHMVGKLLSASRIFGAGPRGWVHLPGPPALCSGPRIR
jgi:hypothetical protein